MTEIATMHYMLDLSNERQWTECKFYEAKLSLLGRGVVRVAKYLLKHNWSSNNPGGKRKEEDLAKDMQYGGNL